MEKGSVERAALAHSRRGMTLLRPYLPEDYCCRTGRDLLSLPRGTVALTTGFWVNGAAETDGPPGTLCLARALAALGFRPLVVTDGLCRGLFEGEGLPVRYVRREDGPAEYRRLLAELSPAALISVEQCGRNSRRDYANMRGVSIAGETPAVDTLFQLAGEDVLTVGIGDGGNEIGMGNLREPIRRHLDLDPCVVEVDDLIIATTSNWGAYALVCALGRAAGRPLLPEYREIRAYEEKLAALGCVDGVTGTPAITVDGFPPETDRAVYESLRALERAG